MPGGEERGGAGQGLGAGPGAVDAVALALLLSENCAAAQSHAGECHQPPASGRGLPVVPEGKAVVGAPGPGPRKGFPP